MLAERFHMDADFLAAMNPGVDFSRAGQTINVIAKGDETLNADVARIEVRKDENSVVAMNSACLLYTSPSPRDATLSRMPSSA